MNIIANYLLSYDGYILNFVDSINTVYYCTDCNNCEIADKMLNIFKILYPQINIRYHKFGNNCVKLYMNGIQVYIYTTLLSELKIPELNYDCNQIIINKYTITSNYTHVRYIHNGIQIMKSVNIYDTIYSRIINKQFAASNDYIYNILNLIYDNGDEYILMDLSVDYYYSTILYAAKLIKSGWTMLEYIIATRSWQLILREDKYYIVYKNNEYELSSVLSKILTL